jgi:hypothetical protein
MIYGEKLSLSCLERNKPKMSCNPNLFLPEELKSYFMKKFSLLPYYLVFRLSILLGFHETSHPLDFKWRWNYWKSKHQRVNLF